MLGAGVLGLSPPCKAAEGLQRLRPPQPARPAGVSYTRLRSSSRNHPARSAGRKGPGRAIGNRPKPCPKMK